jgi:uncharacterized protein with HEPN domain
MSKDKQRLFDYLQHIVEAIARIQRYIEDIDELAFLDNELIQDAVIRNLEIVGEASQNIYKNFPDFVSEHSDVPFLAAYEMRNALAHGYFKVDFEIVWKTIERDLPELEVMIDTLLKQFN